jgi:hypothetical protein
VCQDIVGTENSSNKLKDILEHENQISVQLKMQFKRACNMHIAIVEIKNGLSVHSGLQELMPLYANTE